MNGRCESIVTRGRPFLPNVDAIVSVVMLTNFYVMQTRWLAGLIKDLRLDLLGAGYFRCGLALLRGLLLDFCHECFARLQYFNVNLKYNADR